MSCEICGRYACTRSFHSLEAQDRYDRAVEAANEVAPEGCTCENNGGGDCPWCEARDIAEAEED